MARVHYRKHVFRSRLEANFAQLLDAYAIRWEYETHDWVVGEQRYYWIDWWLPELKLWVETKGKFNRETGDLHRFLEFAELKMAALEPVILAPGGSAGVGLYCHQHVASVRARLEEKYEHDVFDVKMVREGLRTWRDLEDAKMAWLFAECPKVGLVRCAHCEAWRIDLVGTEWSMVRRTNGGGQRTPCERCGYIERYGDMVSTVPLEAHRGKFSGISGLTRLFAESRAIWDESASVAQEYIERMKLSGEGAREVRQIAMEQAEFEPVDPYDSSRGIRLVAPPHWFLRVV